MIIRTVMVLLTFSDQVLLLFHKKHNKWMGPGGHIESGELDHEAAERELREETGLSISFDTQQLNSRATVLPQPFTVHSYRDLTNNTLELDYTFVKEVNYRTWSSKLTNPEGHLVKWVNISEAINSLDMYTDTRQQLVRIINS